MNLRTIVSRILLGLAVLFLATLIYEVGVRAILRPFITLPALLPNSVPLFFLFALFHALYALGWLHTVILFVATIVFFWVFEQIGITTGLLYGAYHYTDILGPKLGHVPILGLFAWFAVVYPSYAIANSIVDGRAVEKPGSLGRVAWLSFLSALVVAAWQAVIGPYMTAQEYGVEALVWEPEGPYFGIPLHFFLGLVVTTFIFYLAYRFFASRVTPRPMDRITTIIAMLPAFAYGAMALSYMLSERIGSLRVIAMFAMGIPVIIAIGRLADSHKAEQAEAPI